MGGVVSQIALWGVRVTGPLNVAGRDVNVYYYRVEPGDDISIPSILDDVPNFRGIQIATLGRATPGTGLWIVECETFRLWLDPDGWLRIMWGFGMPGAGKTIAASIVINALEAHAKQSAMPVCVCYIYFRYSDHNKATTQTVLEVLVKQTLERHPGCLPLVNEVYARHIREKTRPSEDELLSLLRQFTSVMIMFYFLDALDEAPPAIQIDIIEKLTSLNIKLFITSRPLRNVEVAFPDVHRFPISAQDQDLDLHIEKELSRSGDLCAILEQGGPTLRDEIYTSIKGNCGGMFLHASLQLALLRECTNLCAVRKTLAAFPSDINELYHQTWHRILAQAPDKALIARNVLTWIVFATRSLTIEELQEAVAICPDTHKFEQDRLDPESTLIGVCHGLVAVEEGTRLVRLVHYTAKDILVDLITTTLPHPHAHLSVVCLARLTKSGLDLRRQNRHLRKAEPLLDYAYDSWSIHAQESRDDPLTQARLAEFAQSCYPFPITFTGWGWGWGWIYDLLLDSLHLLAYFNLPVALAGSDQLYNPNIAPLVAESSKRKSSSETHQGMTALCLACQQGNYLAVKELLELPNTLVNKAGIGGITPLMWAAGSGHEAAVGLLLAHPDINVNAVCKEFRRTALDWASWYGHVSTAKLLLSHPDIIVNMAAHKEKTTPLHNASEMGHSDVVALLLARPDVDINTRNRYGRTALRQAVKADEPGRQETVKLLLVHPKVEVNVEDNAGNTPLSLAARMGNEDAVRLLLAHPSIRVGTRELEAARDGNQWDHGWTSEARGHILSLLEEFLTVA